MLYKNFFSILIIKYLLRTYTLKLFINLYYYGSHSHICLFEFKFKLINLIILNSLVFSFFVGITFQAFHNHMGLMGAILSRVDIEQPHHGTEFSVL